MWSFVYRPALNFNKESKDHTIVKSPPFFSELLRYWRKWKVVQRQAEYGLECSSTRSPWRQPFSRVFLHRGAVGSQKCSETCAPFKLGLLLEAAALRPGTLTLLCLVFLRLAFRPVRHSLANPTTQSTILAKLNLPESFQG